MASPGNNEENAEKMDVSQCEITAQFLIYTSGMNHFLATSNTAH